MNFNVCFAKPYTKKRPNRTLSSIEPNVSSFAYREPVAPNRTQNQYGDRGIRQTSRVVFLDATTVLPIQKLNTLYCHIYRSRTSAKLSELSARWRRLESKRVHRSDEYMERLRTSISLMSTRDNSTVSPYSIRWNKNSWTLFIAFIHNFVIRNAVFQWDKVWTQYTFLGWKCAWVCWATANIFTHCNIILIFEPRYDKTKKMSVRPANSDQPGHPPSLMRVFAVRSMGS